jgi:hypothetical protein
MIPSICYMKYNAWAASWSLSAVVLAFCSAFLGFLPTAVTQDQCLLNQPSFSVSIKPVTTPPSMHCAMYVAAAIFTHRKAHLL